MIKDPYFTFTSFGDSRTYIDDWKVISDAVLPSDFILFMGDIVEVGGDTSLWNKWFSSGSNFLGNNLVYHTG